MAIVDQYGNPVTTARRFAHASDPNRNRGVQWHDVDRSIDDLIPSHDRKTLAVLSRRLFVNMGVPRAAIRQKASYSVGRAWLPTYAAGGATDEERSADGEAWEELRSWLVNVWYPLCDARGGLNDWWRLLRTASESMDRDGEVFVLLLRGPADDPFPRCQLVPSWQVGGEGDNGKVERGPYKGLGIRDGVIYSGVRPVAYRVNVPGTFVDVSARDMVHVFDSTFAEGGRGLPAFVHALEDFKHMLQSTEYERIAQAALSSIVMMEHNELGGPDLDDPGVAVSYDAEDGTGFAHQTMAGGAVRYFKAGSGGKLEALKNDRPGDAWESFHDRLIRAALTGLPWPYAMVWKSPGQGTAERADIVKARRAVEERQQTLRFLARRLVTFAAAVAAETGRAPAVRNLLRLDFTMPPRLTVDDGREERSLIESHRAGHVNETEIQGFRGRDVETHYAERAREAALKERARRAAEAEYEVSIDPREMGLVIANEKRADVAPEEDEL